MKNVKIVNLIILVLLLTILTTGCGKSDARSSKEYVIGINQFMEHPALDDAREGFIDGLKELDMDVEINYLNSQGDIPNSLSISEKLLSDKVDLIYSIGTPAAQSAKQVSKDTPVLFSAVTDPVEAGLVEDWGKVGGNVTGTSDRAPVEDQVKLFKELDNSIETIGIIYNINESNSEVQIEQVQKYSKDEDLKVEVIGVNNINDVAQSMDALIKKVDAVYILSDNMIASSVGLVKEKLIDANMISISTEESQVAGGILLTNGLSYYELGKETAKMAKKILQDGKNVSHIPVVVSENNKIKINKSTWEALGLDKNLNIYKNADELIGN